MHLLVFDLELSVGSTSVIGVECGISFFTSAMTGLLRGVLPILTAPQTKMSLYFVWRKLRRIFTSKCNDSVGDRSGLQEPV